MKKNLIFCASLIVMMLVGSTAFSGPGKGEVSKVVYQASNFTAQASPAGSSVNWNVGPVSGGTSFSFDLTYSIQQNASTVSGFPALVTFAASTNSSPDGQSDALVTGEWKSPTNGETTSPYSSEPGNLGMCSFASYNSICTETITIVVPTVPGAYTVKILPRNPSNQGDPHNTGVVSLENNGGLAINFIVAIPSCTPRVTHLTVDTVCVIYHQPSATLEATLTTTDGVGLAGQAIRFNLDGIEVGTASTDASGVASLSYDPSQLPVGDHSLTAAFDGSCEYQAAGGETSLGVTYNFLGFQQPINADGSSVFKGISVPVKIKISDYNNAPVPDALVYVFYQLGTTYISGTKAEANGSSSTDSGNMMRYDENADQYIFNWNVGALVSGTYTILANLGEGSACCSSRSVTVSLDRNSAPGRNK